MKKIINILALLLLIVGFVILIQPYVELHQKTTVNHQAISDFKERVRQAKADVQGKKNQASGGNSETSAISSTVEEHQDEIPFADLYQEMRSYNHRIYRERQSELRDAFSYTTGDLRFQDAGLVDDMVGYLTIDRMNIELAVYIGSSYQNMKKGATVMYNTSVPIGGVNTNCVIAAHRSNGFFGDIEAMQEGDIVRMTNLWEELTYRVVKIIVIDPYDTDKVKIIPGRDMLTLLTCHPYWDNSQRYIVYCERVEPSAQTPLQQEDSFASLQEPSSVQETSGSHPQEQGSAQSLPAGVPFISSADTIRNEHLLRMTGIVLTFVFIVIFLIMLIRSLVDRRRSSKEKTNESNQKADES